MKNKPYKLTSFYVGYKNYVKKEELLKTMHYMLCADGTYDDWEIHSTELNTVNTFDTRFELDAHIGEVSIHQAVTIPSGYCNIIGDFYNLDDSLIVIEAFTQNDSSVINVVHVCAGYNWGDVYRRHDADEKKRGN